VEEDIELVYPETDESKEEEEDDEKEEELGDTSQTYL
jgi:hypothetical protein